MEQVGKIVGLKDGMAELEVRRPSACGTSCTACKVACDQNMTYLTLPNTLDGDLGDFVEIGTDSAKVIKFAFTAYGIPLVIFIGVVLLASRIFAGFSYQEALAMGLGVLSFALSHLVLKRIDKKNAAISDPIMLRILE